MNAAIACSTPETMTSGGALPTRYFRSQTESFSWVGYLDWSWWKGSKCQYPSELTLQEGGLMCNHTQEISAARS